MKVDDRLYLRVSKSGKGLKLSNEKLDWRLIANKEHLTSMLLGNREKVVFTVVKKEEMDKEK